MTLAGVKAAQLPVRGFAERIVTAVRDNPFTIIIGETGSGKTTQISQVRLMTAWIGLLPVPEHLANRAVPVPVCCSACPACSYLTTCNMIIVHAADPGRSRLHN